jgi:large subunit ribosomal protein L25
MTATASLNASARSENGKGAARKIRMAGNIPAVIYGHTRQPMSLTINARETDRLLQRIATGATVIELNIDGAVSKTLIREIQRHPYKKQIMHIDFQELVVGETISMYCPIMFVGVPDGVRQEGGILDQVMHQLHISVDPSNIPNHIDVDVTHLKVGRSIHVSELVLPAGIKVLDDQGATICVVGQSRASIEAATAESNIAEPELIRKVKPDDTK